MHNSKTWIRGMFYNFEIVTKIWKCIMHFLKRNQRKIKNINNKEKKNWVHQPGMHTKDVRVSTNWTTKAYSYDIRICRFKYNQIPTLADTNLFSFLPKKYFNCLKATLATCYRKLHFSVQTNFVTFLCHFIFTGGL